MKSDSPITSLKEPKDIAGLRIITSSGTIQEKILLEWDRQNQALGLAPAELQYYDDEAAWNLAVQSGRADAMFSVNASLSYLAARAGNLKQVGTVSAGWPLTAETGITTRRGSGVADTFTRRGQRADRRWPIRRGAGALEPDGRGGRSVPHQPARPAEGSDEGRTTATIDHAGFLTPGSFPEADPRDGLEKGAAAVRLRRAAGLRQCLDPPAPSRARRVLGNGVPGRGQPAHSPHPARQRGDPDRL